MSLIEKMKYLVKSNYSLMRLIRMTLSLRFILISILLSLGIFLSSCSLIEVSEIPVPQDQLLVHDKVIKEIRIQGNEHTNEELIYRAMISKVGDVYKEKNTDKDRRWLKQLGIFTYLLFETEEEDDGIILIVTVEEVNPYIPAPSFDITDENGLEIGASLYSPNLFGIASYLSVFFRVGGATNIGLKYRNPELPEANWWNGYSLEYYYTSRINKLYDFYENTSDFLFQYVTYINDNLSLGPRFTYLNLKSDQPDITLDNDDQDIMPGFGAVFRLNTLNTPSYPTEGWWTELLVTKYDGNANYWHGIIDFRRYWEISSYRNSVAFYSLTTLSTGTVGEDIPIYMQFNIGGTNSVRGWELGSREGKNQFINTLEYWHVLLEMKRYKFWFLKEALALQVAVFSDAGTAWSTENEFHQNWILGGGVGLRLLTASGVSFRVDFALGQKAFGVSLSIGSSEKAVAQRDRVR